jgi:predicted nucleic acid-binding protein
VRLFLDSSVLIAAAVSAEGASREVFRLASMRDWRLITTPYAVGEVVRNLVGFTAPVTVTWLRLRDRLHVADDVLTIDKPAVFPVTKDRPILFSALATADVLLTLVRIDFGRLLGTRFYGLAIMTPGTWLVQEREVGRPGVS